MRSKNKTASIDVEGTARGQKIPTEARKRRRNATDKGCKWKAGPTRTQRHAKTEVTPEATSSRSNQGHTGACQDRKAPAALTGG